MRKWEEEAERFFEGEEECHPTPFLLQIVSAVANTTFSLSVFLGLVYAVGVGGGGGYRG